MTAVVDKEATTEVVGKIVDYLEERKTKKDRRVNDSSDFPACIERRSGKDRRASAN